MVLRGSERSTAAITARAGEGPEMGWHAALSPSSFPSYACNSLPVLCPPQKQQGYKSDGAGESLYGQKTQVSSKDYVPVPKPQQVSDVKHLC